MIFEIDKAILLFIRDYIVNDYLTPVMKFITALGNSGIFWIILCLALMIYKPTRRLGIYCTAALALEYFCCTVIIKNIVKRGRPYTKIEGLTPLIKKPGQYSFPSGHASAALAVSYTLLRKAPKKFSIPIFILGLLICFSRLYVAVHYPSDVLGGAVLGILFSYIGDFVVDRIQKRFVKNDAAPAQVKDSTADS